MCISSCESPVRGWIIRMAASATKNDNYYKRRQLLDVNKERNAYHKWHEKKGISFPENLPECKLKEKHMYLLKTFDMSEWEKHKSKITATAKIY